MSDKKKLQLDKRAQLEEVKEGLKNMEG